MVEDKYIGLALAISGTLAIGSSFIITKKGLNDAGRTSQYENASDNLAYLRNPIWWLGMITMVVGEIANFSAYLFAPAILVTPLGALSVLIGAVLASFLLKEELGHIGRVGCTLCLIGSLIIVMHAPADKEVQTVDEILHYAIQPGFLLYVFTVLVFTLVMIYVFAPRYGRTNPIIYISICSLVGSVSIMAIKGFGVALKLTFNGNNQFGHPSTYVFAIVVVVCIVVQMNYFNKALDIFSTNVVNPMYYVGFSTATLVASLILFQGLNTDDGVATVSLLCGFVITFLGVHLLNLSHMPEASASLGNGHARRNSTIENGLLNPRLSISSISGRMSLDRWNGPNGGLAAYRTDPPLSAGGGHARRSSLYRHQTSTLFSAFGDDEDDEFAGRPREEVGLQRLREEPEMDDEGELSEVDERTHLRSADGRLPQHLDVNRRVLRNADELMPFVNASIDAFLVTAAATTIPWIYFTIWRTPPTDGKSNLRPQSTQQQQYQQEQQHGSSTRSFVALFVALHSIYILYNLIVCSQQNIFTVLDVPLTEPSDAIRARLLHLAHVPDLPETLERLLMRLSSFDVRHIYVRFGHQVVEGCEHCATFYDFVLYALPRPLLEYTREAAVVGVVTIRGSVRERWRPWGLCILGVSAALEAYFLMTTNINIGGDKRTVMLYDNLWTLRQLLFLLLPAGLHLLRPTPRRSTPLDALPELTVLANQTFSRIQLLKYTRGAVARTPELQDAAGEWWAKGRQEGEWVREDQEMQELAKKLQWGIESDGELRVKARSIVESLKVGYQPSQFQ